MWFFTSSSAELFILAMFFLFGSDELWIIQTGAWPSLEPKVGEPESLIQWPWKGLSRISKKHIASTTLVWKYLSHTFFAHFPTFSRQTFGFLVHFPITRNCWQKQVHQELFTDSTWSIMVPVSGWRLVFWICEKRDGYHSMLCCAGTKTGLIQQTLTDMAFSLATL